MTITANATEFPAPGGNRERTRRMAWRLAGAGYCWRHSARRLMVLALAALAVLTLTSWELRGSHLQAMILSRWAHDLHYELKPGISAGNIFPQTGPLDQRLGYTQVPAWSTHLVSRGFEVTAQAHQSDALRRFLGDGFFAPQGDKGQAGLELLDCRGTAFFKAQFPREVYAAAAEVPPLVAQTLAFIENKELLTPAAPRSNPALEWKRLGRAVLDRAPLRAGSERSGSGGSTLATQLEKFRHSPQGRTASVADKYRQMVSASVRAYQDGEETSGARERILLDYLNGLPLGARRGQGEVNGLLDGMRLWWGADPAQANTLLRAASTPQSPAKLDAAARTYRQMLALLLAQRRPSFYLGPGHQRLTELTDSYLRLLAQAGVISPALRDATLRTVLTSPEGIEADHPGDPDFAQPERASPPPPAGDRKAVSAARIELATLLEMPRLYDLDRLDLSATSTLDSALQTAVSQTLRQLHQADQAHKAGLIGEHLLRPGNDLSKVFYSFTLYESEGGANRLRAQTDNLDQPFDINTGAKLELGSTAKLRTLISYLEIVAGLHHELSGLQPAELAQRKPAPRERLTRWAIEHLRSASDRSLPTMLAAAMQRRYSAHPGEAFFTGGGTHYFSNFDAKDDARRPTVTEAFRDSVNLVFIRLMRDVVDHTLARSGHPIDLILSDRKHPERLALLTRFADEDSRRRLRAHYRQHRQQTPDQLSAFLALPRGTDKPHVTPLERWVASQLRQHPGVSLAELTNASHAQRLADYDWLLRLRDRGAQNNRIAPLLERQAFAQIHASWQRLGYPFDSLVPSYASAIGSSGDRPAALADLMGIIVNHGLRQPVVHVEHLRFAAGTPYETALQRQAQGASPRVLAPEIAATVRQALTEVVEQGSARRLRGALKGADNKPLWVGGKTGTGDNRLGRYSPRGTLIASRAINRTATFVFFIGERHFGTLTAYVPGEQADAYQFTSALPVQIVKNLAPVLARQAKSTSPACAPATPNQQTFAQAVRK